MKLFQINNLKKISFIILLTFCFSITDGFSKPRHKKQKTEQKNKKATKSTSKEEKTNIKTTSKIKSQKEVCAAEVKDSIKKAKNNSKEIVAIDSVAEYKGKFKPFKKSIHASYYAEQFHGKRTASGKIFNMNALTAAHKTLPFGTKIKVTNEANGKTVIVEINDRGPYVKGREIDLSKKAFTTIAAQGTGYIKATLEILQK